MDTNPNLESQSRKGRILALQVAQSYHQQAIALLVSGFNGAIVTALLWNAIPASRLLPWIATLAAVTLARFALASAYHRPGLRRLLDNVDWGRCFLLGTFASGLVWGASGIFLFHPESFAHQVFLAFALGGMIAGAMPLLSALHPAFQLFAIPAALPITLQMLAQGDQVHQAMGLMIVVFTLAMTASASRFHRVNRESIELRIQLSDSIEERLVLDTIAHMDPLTGVGNRRLFDETLDGEWKRALRAGSRLSLIMADIDYFKRYNDSLGHPAGDACLKRVARTMDKAARRPGDLVARIGGEEFACLLPGTPAEDAMKLAEKLREAIEGLGIRHPDSAIADHVTISLGVSELVPHPGMVPSDLIEAADTALYAAKRQGRNCVVHAL
ncbi:GGDEF domain-containing protein [Imhoffiella purpurea]|uniref:diguanylate cyclase n=1 Tax=Imhoffiella purpurea TaxID=1249627 RepID=W9V3Q1_9GAMM|nr:GGDEF domain-containing protein [Imhoffiella purpurea]EXJ13944.1 response regulator [Imhoffiella purpurea]